MPGLSVFLPKDDQEPVPAPTPVAPQPVSDHLQVRFVAESEAIEPEVAAAILSRTHLLGGDAWTWEQLRDYVIGQMEKKWGPRPRNLLKESGIFKGFVSRHGVNARRIAEVAFTVHGGMWRGAPIGVERFTQGNDPWFAEVIAQNL